MCASSRKKVIETFKQSEMCNVRGECSCGLGHVESPIASQGLLRRVTWSFILRVVDDISKCFTGTSNALPSWGRVLDVRQTSNARRHVRVVCLIPSPQHRTMNGTHQ